MKYLASIIRILFLALFIFLLANGKVVLWLAPNNASQSTTFYLPSGKWKSSTLACVVRSKPGCRSDFRQDLLRVCLPYEYSDDPHRMAVQKAEASNTEYP